MIANIPTPQRTNNKVQGEFYPLQKQELIALRKAKLINNTAFVHLALRSENPFCDRPVEIRPKEFALSWNIPESSIYKAIAQLKKLGLIAIKSGRLLIEWINQSAQNTVETVSNLNNQYKNTGEEPELSDPAINYQIQQTIIRSENKLSDPAINYQIRQNQQPEALSDKDLNSSQTIQTDQTNHTYSDWNQETHIDYWSIAEESENNQVEEYVNSVHQQIETNVLVKTDNPNQEKNVRASSISVRKQVTNNGKQENCNSASGLVPLNQVMMQKGEQTERIPQSPFPSSSSSLSPNLRNWQWLPGGAWNVNGKLDPAFQEWLAKKWVVKYQDCDLHESKANVLAYFRNDPAKLPIRWEHYQQEYLAKAENIKLRLDNGCTISPEQQQQTIVHLGALRPLDPEQSISARDGDMITGNREQKNISDSEPEQVITVASKNNESVEDKSIVVTDEFGNSARYKTYSQEEAEKIPVNEGFKKRLDEWLKSMSGRGNSFF